MGHHIVRTYIFGLMVYMFHFMYLNIVFKYHIVLLECL